VRRGRRALRRRRRRGGRGAARCRDDAALLATADGTALVNQTVWGAHVVRGLLVEEARP
jgi:hypothetical protein